MKTPGNRRTLTYIVRVWAEYLDETPQRWCGVIEPVGSQEKVHFSNMDEFNRFMQNQIVRYCRGEEDAG